MSEDSAIPLVVAFAFTLGCGVWVYFDSQRISRKEGGSDHHNAMAWAAGTVLLWIVVLPMYFVSRFKRLKKLGVAAASTPATTAGNGAAVYLGACAAVVLAAGLVWFMAFRGSVPGCEDEATLDQVRLIARAELKRLAPDVRSPFGIRVTAVYGEGYDEGAKKRSCKASIQFNAPKPNVAELIARFNGNATNDIELLRAQIEWEQSPHQDVLKQGIIDVDVTYTATRELQSKNLLVQVTPADAEKWSILLSYLALAQRLNVVAASASPGTAPVTAPAAAAVLPPAIAAPQAVTTPAPAADRKMFQLREVQMCGAEALCVHAMSGETLTTNAFGLDDRQKQSLEAKAAGRGSLCFRGLSGTGKALDFESVSEYCQ